GSGDEPTGPTRASVTTGFAFTHRIDASLSASTSQLHARTCCAANRRRLSGSIVARSCIAGQCARSSAPSAISHAVLSATGGRALAGGAGRLRRRRADRDVVTDARIAERAVDAHEVARAQAEIAGLLERVERRVRLVGDLRVHQLRDRLDLRAQLRRLRGLAA